jgi:hypothetical protein
MNMDIDIRLFAVLTSRSRHERRFDRLKDDLGFNVLVAVERIDDSQQLVRIHSSYNFSATRQSNSAIREAPHPGHLVRNPSRNTT